MTKKNNFKFNSLTPDILLNNKNIYTESLNYAFGNNDIKNIAITGIYGAGKSTVWRTYVNDKKLNNVITISLGKYEDEYELRSKDEDGKYNKIELDNRVEKQLINQLVSQVKSNLIPLCKYKIKSNKSILFLIAQTIISIFFISSIFLWLFKDDIEETFFVDQYSLNYNFWLAITLLVTFIIPLAYFFFLFYRVNTFKVSKINFKGAEANLKEETVKDETILDRDIKEIIYIIKSSKSKVIVFEDLDRYNNVEIFTKLRELNFLVNSSNNKKPIKFIYMLKDSLFESKNRTKFFDFIIPIVPVVDSNNSENMLITALKAANNIPDKKTITKISLYIDDMRLLKNIVNEYLIYENNVAIKDLCLDSNKLFSLVVLKNIFPREFELLQENQGYIVNVFNNLISYKKDTCFNLEKDIKDIDERIKNERTEELLKKRSNIEKNIRDLKIGLIKEQLKLINPKQLDNIFKDTDNIITYNQYFPMIRFLIIEGLIDETYWHYKGYFYSGSLGVNDTVFIKNLLEAKEQDIFLNIENPLEVTSRLELVDYSKFNIFNQNLLKSCIELNKINEVIATINSAEINNNYKSIAVILSSYDYDTIKNFVYIVFNKYSKYLIKILNQYEIKGDATYKNILIAIFTCSDITENILTLFKSYIEPCESVIELITDEDFDFFIKNITLADIKFDSIYKSLATKTKIKKIEEIKAYKINIKNEKFILEKIIGKTIEYSKLLNDIYDNTAFVSTKEYIESSYTSFISLYIDNNIDNAPFFNKEDIVIKIINSDLENTYKKRYIELNETIISDIRQIKESTKDSLTDDLESKRYLIDILMDKNKILFTSDNIKTYCNEIDKYTEAFIKYLDRNLNNENYEEILLANKKISNLFINNPHVSDKFFNYLLMCSDIKINILNKEIDEKRIKKLIEKNHIAITNDNFSVLLNKKLYKEIVIFINKLNEDMQDKAVEILLSLDLVDELIYLLINSDILDRNVNKLLATIISNYDIKKINFSKVSVFNYIINNNLSIDNINYICKNFENFQLKEKLLTHLEEQHKFDKITNENINDFFIQTAFSSVNVSTNSKIDIIGTRINSGATKEELASLIRKVDDISELANVWNNKRPKLNNEFKKRIGKILIDAKYLKSRNGKAYMSVVENIKKD